MPGGMETGQLARDVRLRRRPFSIPFYIKCFATRRCSSQLAKLLGTAEHAGPCRGGRSEVQRGWRQTQARHAPPPRHSEPGALPKRTVHRSWACSVRTPVHVPTRLWACMQCPSGGAYRQRTAQARSRARGRTCMRSRFSSSRRAKMRFCPMVM